MNDDRIRPPRCDRAIPLLRWRQSTSAHMR